MENLIMNTALQNSVGSESVEFFVQSKRVQPIKKTLPAVIFGFIWLIFTTFFIFILTTYFYTYNISIKNTLF